MSDKGFIWNPSNCECECDKSCDVGEYLDYENCKCIKKTVDKLTEECIENIDEVKIANENEHKNKCSSCILYIVFFQHFLQLTLELVLIFFTTNAWILIKKMLPTMIMSIKQKIIN